MKKVLTRYDVSNDLIECPDRIADNFDDNIDGIFKWIETNQEGKKYKMVCEVTGKIGYWINKETVLTYLNFKCIKEGEEKAKLIKENVSRRIKADAVTYF